jgi:hypothetical protein
MSAAFVPDHDIVKDGIVQRALGNGNKIKAMLISEDTSNFLSKITHHVGAGAAC